MCVGLLVCNLSSDVPSRVTGSSTNKSCQDRHVPTTEQESWHTHTGRAETMLPVFHVSFRLPPLMGAEIWLTHLEIEELRGKKKKFVWDVEKLGQVLIKRERGCKVTYCGSHTHKLFFRIFLGSLEFSGSPPVKAGRVWVFHTGRGFTPQDHPHQR